MERVLEIEMENHLGEKSKGLRTNGNSRNGYTHKTLKTDASEIPIRYSAGQRLNFRASNREEEPTTQRRPRYKDSNPLC